MVEQKNNFDGEPGFPLAPPTLRDEKILTISNNNPDLNLFKSRLLVDNAKTFAGIK